MSTIKRHIPHLPYSFVALLGIHAFFYNKNILSDKGKSKFFRVPIYDFYRRHYDIFITLFY